MDLRTRLLFEVCFAAVLALDGFAALCTAIVGALYGLAWLLAQPIVGLGRASLALSRRILGGRP